MTEKERAKAAEENYARMRKQLDERLNADKRLTAIADKIKAKTADFRDTAEYSELVSNHISAVIQENIGNISSPLGKQYVCEALLKDHYNTINDVLGNVQVSIDERNGIHIAPQKAPYPAERVAQVAHALEDTTVPFDTIRRRAGAPVANVAKSFHDDYVKENAKFRSDAGIKCFITRTTDGKGCEWCSALAGRYVYGEHPADVFRRHDSCRCVVIYNDGRKRQMVWSKKTWSKEEERAYLKELDAKKKAKRLSAEQAREIQGRNLKFRGIKNTTSSQNRKHVVYDGTEKTITRGEKIIVLRHVDGTNTNMYISARCNLKPKERHNIDVRIREAMDILGISNLDNLPTIHVLTNAEIQKNAIASYNAITNVITVDETFGKNLEKIISLQKDCASKDNKLSTIIHELFHWSDAQEYQKHFGKITDANYEKYIEHLNKNRKKTIDKLGINEYNVGEISDYAKHNYERHNYDEVFTEYRVQEMLR